MTIRLITNARLFTAVDTTVISDGTVLVDGDRIVWAGPAAEVPPAVADVVATETLDVDGKFVMPGMTESTSTCRTPTRIRRSSTDNPFQRRCSMPSTTPGPCSATASPLRSVRLGSGNRRPAPVTRSTPAASRPAAARIGEDVGSTGSNADAQSPGSEGRKRIADGPWAVRAAVREIARRVLTS